MVLVHQEMSKLIMWETFLDFFIPNALSSLMIVENFWAFKGFLVDL